MPYQVITKFQPAIICFLKLLLYCQNDIWNLYELKFLQGENIYMITPSSLTGGALIMLLVVVCIPLIFSIIGSCLVMKRLTGSWWKALIPFYSTYAMCDAIDEVMLFGIQIGLGFVGGILGYFDLSTLAYFCSLAAAITSIVIWYKVCKWFGHGIGFTLGIIFLSPIFLMILGCEE